ncbi:hypothetical protein FDB55_10635 [Clostridium botulinum]|uniref:Lipoprotein n=1 Tax=Clostridium botulinum TaxID=1491 RepID=A0A846JNY8_CLOBO|nr:MULTISPECIES: hypothetical protein [Clostridium]ACD50970.1 putative lipoprotein [Clostridium botulinum E3 str. Alaska E43]AJF30055.1 hypothetical protein ST13_10250 [Clostridium botulinum]AJF33118.1 hypothetical protein ST12_10250 [Clostridium botulinum]KAI3350558.1 hypothetical protein CIT18_02545 [Clostridium botulinum]KOM86918.1 hypothetical protein ACP51_14930 [Clostridium botulinum]
MKGNKILATVLIFISCFQSIILYNTNILNSNLKKEELYYKSLTTNDYKNVSNINSEFENFNDLEFLEGQKQSDGSWVISLKIEGEKDEILESVSKLRNYAIKNYKIEHNKDSGSLTIELSKNNIKM